MGAVAADAGVKMIKAEGVVVNIARCIRVSREARKIRDQLRSKDENQLCAL